MSGSCGGGGKPERPGKRAEAVKPGFSMISVGRGRDLDRNSILPRWGATKGDAGMCKFGNQMTRKLASRAGSCLLAAAVLAAGVSAPDNAAFANTAAVATTPTAVTYGTWKLSVKADAATVAAGLHDFNEYVTIDYDGITAQEMSRMGFGPILPVTSSGAGGSMNFTVELSSESQGKTVWTGNMTSTTMTGNLNWTKNGKVYTYTFTGAPFTPVEAES
jgi:hypothetical protein